MEDKLPSTKDKQDADDVLLGIREVVVATTKEDALANAEHAAVCDDLRLAAEARLAAATAELEKARLELWTLKLKAAKIKGQCDACTYLLQHTEPCPTNLRSYEKRFRRSKDIAARMLKSTKAKIAATAEQELTRGARLEQEAPELTTIRDATRFQITLRQHKLQALNKELEAKEQRMRAQSSRGDGVAKDPDAAGDGKGGDETVLDSMLPREDDSDLRLLQEAVEAERRQIWEEIARVLPQSGGLGGVLDGWNPTIDRTKTTSSSVSWSPDSL